jgi:hypothetical protein
MMVATPVFPFNPAAAMMMNPFMGMMPHFNNPPQ